ncbi:MAG: GvpL/GvpF family gas vesicle protein [Pseudomonadota bacterium]
MSEQQNQYLYAVIRRDEVSSFEDIKPVSAPEATLEAHELGDVAVVTSAIELDEVMSTRRNMLTHTRALEQLMLGRPILPFSFGTIVNDLAVLEPVIKPENDRLLSDLEGLRGHIEVGVRASWNEEKIFTEIVDENEELRAIAQRVRTRPASETYYERIELGKRVDEIMKTKREAEGNALADALSQVAVRSVTHSSSADMIVHDAAYLINEAAERDLYAVLEGIENQKPDRMNIKYLSPVPPYNFVAMTFTPPTVQQEAA